MYIKYNKNNKSLIQLYWYKIRALILYITEKPFARIFYSID